MKHRLTTLAIVAALWTTGARADAPGEFTDDEWTDAARAALAIVERKQHLIVVLDDKLTPAARAVLSRMRETIARDALPEQDKYVLPPGDYLLVRKFAPQGNRFEFVATTGWINRAIGGSCGASDDFFVARDAQGHWVQVGPSTLTMC